MEMRSVVPLLVGRREARVGLPSGNNVRMISALLRYNPELMERGSRSMFFSKKPCT